MAPVAAIDVGTNSTRLLIRDLATGETVERRQTITRLGKGTDATRRLDPAAIERTVAALQEYQALIERHAATPLRITATSAARDATNGDDFLDAAEAVVGVRPEILSGVAEGQLAFAGATAGLAPALGPFLVVDIGGGSTECMVGTTEIEAVVSFDIGSVRLTERHLEHDPPAPEELTNAIAEASELFEDLQRQMPQVGEVRTVVGVAGTITTVAAVEIGMLEWDHDVIHHFTLSRAAAEDVFRTLATESVEDRKHNPGLEPARADVIVGGCCVLVALMRTLRIDEVLISESDILDGIAASLG